MDAQSTSFGGSAASASKAPAQLAPASGSGVQDVTPTSDKSGYKQLVIGEKVHIHWIPPNGLFTMTHTRGTAQISGGNEGKTPVITRGWIGDDVLNHLQVSFGAPDDGPGGDFSGGEAGGSLGG